MIRGRSALEALRAAGIDVPTPKGRRGKRAKGAEPSEADIQKQVVNWLRLSGLWALRINTGAIIDRTGRPVFFHDGGPGISDVFLGCPKGWGAIEVKRPGEKATEAQLAALDAVRKAGGIGFVADSVGAVEQGLKAEGFI